MHDYQVFLKSLACVFLFFLRLSFCNRGIIIICHLKKIQSFSSLMLLVLHGLQTFTWQKTTPLLLSNKAKYHHSVHCSGVSGITLRFYFSHWCRSLSTLKGLKNFRKHWPKATKCLPLSNRRWRKWVAAHIWTLYLLSPFKFWYFSLQ